MKINKYMLFGITIIALLAGFTLGLLIEYEKAQCMKTPLDEIGKECSIWIRL